MPVKLIVALAAAALTFFGGAWNTVSGGGTYRVTAHFLSAEGVVPGNDVLADGVKIGSVDSVAVAPDGETGALVRLKIDPKYAPLHTGTRAAIRTKGFLGTTYVDMTPGTDGNAAIRNNGSIPMQDTAAPVDLDQVMDIFDPATRDKMQIATQQGGATFDGRGQDLNNILAQLPSITANLADASHNVDQSIDQLDALTVEFDRVAAQMASEDQNLRGDITNGASLLDTIAAHETQLQGEIVYANRGLGAVNAGLSGHEKDVAQLLIEMPALQAHLRDLSATSDSPLADINMCYADIIEAIAGLRSATGYRHPAGSTDGNGNMLRVYTTVAPPSTDPMPGSLTPSQLSCSGGTPTP